MKKLIILILSLFLISCFWSPKEEDIESAKKDLLWDSYQKQEDTIKDDVDASSWSQDDSSNDELKNTKNDDDLSKDSYYDIEYLTDNKFIDLYDLSWKDLDSFEVEINWETLTNVDKIEVSFSNEASDYPDDLWYELKTFKSWDKTFKYRASSNFRVYDFWKNEYIFKAYFWNEVSELKLTIFRKYDLDENLWLDISYEKKLFWKQDDKLYLSFPKGSNFWDPVFISETELTYSGINDLKIVKENNSMLKCEQLTDFLLERYSWYYWNTCRDIIKDNWISFYVLSLVGDTYVYEKHYVDLVHELYWKVVLEKWDFIVEDDENKSKILEEKIMN